MNILVLGGAGFIGREITHQLAAAGHAVVVASRQPRVDAHEAIRTCALDVLDEARLVQAMVGIDLVVNATTGGAATIADGARVLCRALQQAQVGRLIHLSSQAVYGAQEGVLTEAAPLEPTLGWYGHAKIEAETLVRRWASEGGRAVVLRPGCVTGPGSPLWESRIARWLVQGQLGDLGAAGDGWSNVVAVQDVALAVAAAAQRLQSSSSSVEVFNLAALDAPRWNQYFADLALSIGAVPLRRVSRRQLWLQSRVLGVPLKVLERLGDRLGLTLSALPPGMPPALVRLFQQHIALDAHLAHRELGVPLRYVPPTPAEPARQGASRAR